MPVFRLNLSIEIEESDEESAICEGRYLLEKWANDCSTDLLNKTKVALTRDGDRGGLNILLPKLSGRCGEHYQGRRAGILEVLEKK